MTDRPIASQQYWQIQLPCDRFPQPKFQFGDQVAIYEEDDQGNRYCEIGVIVGMQCITESNKPAQWYYRIQYLKCSYGSWLVGTYDEYFEEESRFVADDSVIEE